MKEAVTISERIELRLVLSYDSISALWRIYKILCSTLLKILIWKAKSSSLPYIILVKEDAGARNIFEFTTMDMTGFLQMLQVLGVATTEHALKQPKVQAIINAKQTENVYDLLLVEQFYQEAFLALSHIYKIPVVSTSTLGYENHMSQMFGIISPWSYVPHGFLPFTDRMSFWERVQNTYNSLYEDLHREYIYFPLMDDLVAKYFGHLSSECKRSISNPHILKAC